jgi:Osmosensitive K+ channel histidine kinase
MGNVLVRIRERIFTEIPEEYRDGLSRELLVSNISREKVLSFVVIALNIGMLYFGAFAPQTSKAGNTAFFSFIHIHILLFIAPLIYLIFMYIKKDDVNKNIKLFKVIHLLVNSFVLILCSLIAVNNVIIDEPPFAYVLAIYFIAAIIFLSPRESFIIYMLSYIAFIIGGIGIRESPPRFWSDVFFWGIALVLATILSGVNYSAFVKNYISSKIILKKNQELDSIYKITEEALRERTKELSKAVEYEKLRTAFFANISHELRTPLNVIFSAQQMLDLIVKNCEECNNKNEINQYTHMIKQNCYRLIRLIANLIDITKIDAGYLQVNLQNCDIVKTVEDITLSVVKYVEDKDIKLTFDTQIEEKTMACDPDKIERIMLNLLSNAVKFTPKGGEIYVNMYDEDENIVISVKDTGIGIPAQMQGLIFERFVQVDETTTRNREGSGIGLSLVKALVEMHGGSIKLISECGRGSEFIIRIPDRVVPQDKEMNENKHLISGQNTERVNVEFSDIYL